MSEAKRPGTLRGPYISLFIALGVIVVLVTGLFLFGYKNKREKEALERQMNYRDKLALYTEKVREAIDRSYRTLAGGTPDAYHDGVAAPRTATEKLDDMIKNWPDYAEPFLLRGRINMIFRDFEAAEADLTKYIDKKPPGASMAYIDRALLTSLRFLYASLADASTAELKKLGEPGKEDVNRFVTWFQEDLQQKNDSDIMNYWNTAVGMGLIQLFNCEYAKAADWFDNYSESMPDPILPRALRILTTLRLWSEAERRVKARAGQLDTLEAEQDRKSLADLLKDLTDLINDSLKVCPTHPELLTLKGHAFLATGQPDEAIAAFQAALKADAGFNLANYGLGRAYLAKGDADKAIETLKAYTLGQAKPLLTAGVHIGFARAYALKNDVEQALKSYAAAIALDPSTELLLERSAFFAKIKKSSEAESDLSFILQTQPDHLDARLARIDLYLETGDRVKALADVEKAEQINASKKLGRDAAIKEKRAAAEKLTPK